MDPRQLIVQEAAEMLVSFLMVTVSGPKEGLTALLRAFQLIALQAPNGETQKTCLDYIDAARQGLVNHYAERKTAKLITLAPSKELVH